MTSGFFGFASGGMISAVLVSSYGLRGLYPLVFCPDARHLALIAVRGASVHRGCESRVRTWRESTPRPNALPFWKVLAIGLPAAVSTTVVLQLTPTYLAELGFDLTFGGFSTAMFGWGGAVGPFLWTAIAHRKAN